MHPLLIKFLILQYIVLAIICGVEGYYAKALYWVGAVVLSLGVLWMR